jgi:GntR family transcriptional repressor for pyruvate dehydrogenase complex
MQIRSLRKFHAEFNICKAILTFMISRQTLTSQVVDHILNLIKSGKVKTGERLPTEKDMTTQLGVSRTCVREAVKSLESLGIVRVRPKIGAVVLDPSSMSVLNAIHISRVAFSQPTDVVVEFRMLIEVELAALAAQKADLTDIEAMEQAIKAQGTSDGPLPYEADIKFHSALAAAAKNPIAIMVLDTVSGILKEQRRQTGEVPGAAEVGLRDHRKILKAIRERNPEKARAAMRSHMITAERYLRVAQASSSSTSVSTLSIQEKQLLRF